MDRALWAEEGLAAEETYLEVDGRRYELWIMRATNPKQMCEPREPDRPNYSRFT